jgi:hypothetical protein
VDSTAGRSDERRVRFERGLLAVVLLAGFVWQRDLVIVVAAFAVAAALVPGGLRPLAVPWDTLVASRVGPPRRTVADRQVRDGDVVLTVGLAVATVLVLVNLGLVGRVVAIAAGIVAALEAAAGQPLASWAMHHVRRRNR